MHCSLLIYSYLKQKYRINYNIKYWLCERVIKNILGFIVALVQEISEIAWFGGWISVQQEMNALIKEGNIIARYMLGLLIKAFLGIVRSCN